MIGLYCSLSRGILKIHGGGSAKGNPFNVKIEKGYSWPHSAVPARTQAATEGTPAYKNTSSLVVARGGRLCEL
jgi:hypothetical protein